MRAVGTMQAARHDILIVQAPLPPALAKNARTGHPFPDRERKKAERLGHPAREALVWNGYPKNLLLVKMKIASHNAPIQFESPTSRKEREKWGTLRFITEKRATRQPNLQPNTPTTLMPVPIDPIIPSMPMPEPIPVPLEPIFAPL
jgi:hypothetical protein